MIGVVVAKSFRMDKTYSRQHQKFVEKENISLNFFVQKRQLIISGSKSLVNFMSKNSEMVNQLYDLMLNKESQEGDFVYETFKPELLPKLTCDMYDKKSWTGDVPYQNLMTYMQVFGFGRSGNKNYKHNEDKPSGWPDTVSFINVEHPSYLSKDAITKVIEGLLTHRNINPRTYFMKTSPHQKVPSRKRKKTMKSAEYVEEPREEATENEDMERNVDIVQQEPLHDEVLHNNNLVNENIEVNKDLEQPHHQQQQLTLDPTGYWYWDYHYGQWYPVAHRPPAN